MDYLDYELQSHQYYEDNECCDCGGCLIDEYFSCICDEEEDDEDYDE